MKKFSMIAFAMLAGMCATSLHAATSEVRATVPFDFVVAGKTLPAGTYRISSVHSNALTIENVNHPSDSVMTRIDPADASQPAQMSMVFNKYGDHYFLHEIDSSAALVNGRLPISKAEKQARQMDASIPAAHTTIALGE